MILIKTPRENTRSGLKSFAHDFVFAKLLASRKNSMPSALNRIQGRKFGNVENLMILCL